MIRSALLALWRRGVAGLEYRLFILALMAVGTLPITLLLVVAHAPAPTIFWAAFGVAIMMAVAFEALQLLIQSVRRLLKHVPTPPPEQQLEDRTIYVPVHVPRVMWHIVIRRAEDDQRPLDLPPPPRPEPEREREERRLAV